MQGMTPPGADSGEHIKKWCVIMGSMTKKELDCVVPLDHPRIMRLAVGAGVHPQMVVQLMQSFKQMEKMLGNMSKAGLLKGGDEALAHKMKRNPQAIMRSLQGAIDPKMLAGVGGAGNLMEMFKGARVAAARRGALLHAAMQGGSCASSSHPHPARVA